MQSVRRLVILGLGLLALIATSSAAQVRVDRVYLPLLAAGTVGPVATTPARATTTATVTPTTATVTPTNIIGITLTSTPGDPPTRTPFRGFDGRWVGTTSVGKPFSFDLVDGMITRLSFGFTAPGCGINDLIVVATYQPPLFIQDSSSFTVSDTIPGPTTISFTLRGSLIWPDTGAGDLIINVQGSSPGAGCSDNQSRAWTAVNQPGSVPTVRATPSATVTPTGTPFVGGARIFDIVLKDPAFPNNTEEYIAIRNTSGQPIVMTGWRLMNASRPDATRSAIPAFVFPEFTLGGDSTIAVFSQAGEPNLEVGDFYWGQQGAVWKAGDRAELRDAQNNFIHSFIVPDQ